MKKTELNRDELIAQLTAIDKADEINTLKTEVADLKAERQKVIQERDAALKHGRDLEKVLEGVSNAMKPVQTSIGNGRAVGRGRVYTPEFLQGQAEVATKTAQSYSAAHRMASQGKIGNKTLTEAFPELGD